MDLVDSFTLPLPIDRAWELLTDLERIAPCLPGAQLTEIEGDLHRGKVKIKVGPITAQFGGVARFTEKDDANYRAVITAEGREARGQGNANALVTAQLTPIEGADGPGSATTVEVNTDLTISGKVAQFGRGVIADVSTKLISQFVANVENMINEGEATGAAAGQPTSEAQMAEGVGEPSEALADTPEAAADEPAFAAAPTVRKIESQEVEAVDLFDLTGMPIAKRLAPLAAVAAVLIAVVVLLRRRSR